MDALISPSLLIEFFRGIKRYKMFDKIRKTNLLDIYPEFEKYYNMKETDNIWSY